MCFCFDQCMILIENKWVISDSWKKIRSFVRQTKWTFNRNRKHAIEKHQYWGLLGISSLSSPSPLPEIWKKLWKISHEIKVAWSLKILKLRWKKRNQDGDVFLNSFSGFSFKRNCYLVNLEIVAHNEFYFDKFSVKAEKLFNLSDSRRLTDGLCDWSVILNKSKCRPKNACFSVLCYWP